MSPLSDQLESAPCTVWDYGKAAVMNCNNKGSSRCNVCRELMNPQEVLAPPEMPPRSLTTRHRDQRKAEDDRKREVRLALGGLQVLGRRHSS